MFISKRILYAFAALLCAANATGQTNKKDSLHILQDNKTINYFELTDNAATIALTPFAEHGFATVHVNHTSGNFRRPMEAEASNLINIATGGFKKKNGWMYKSNFAYTKQYDKNIAWSGVANAYEGNPFIWADSSVGNWERDHIKAAISVAAPVIFKKLQTGLTLDYQVGSGARITEPKPFYRQRYIALQPGINWLIASNKSIGITGKINFIQEENELGFYSNNNVLLYRIRGYGTFSKAPFVNGERKRKGTDLQATAHYQQQLGKYQVLLSAYAAQRDEEINEGVAIQQPTGFFTEIRFGGNAMVQTGNATKGKSMSVAYQIRNGYADDVIFRAESASYNEHLLQANISLWYASNASKSLWQFTLSPAFKFIDNTDQATLTQLTAATVGANFKANWRKQLKPNIHLQLQPFAGYYYVADSEFINQRPNIITKNIVLPDYQFFATNHAKFGALAVLEINQIKTKLVHSFSVIINNTLSTNNTMLNGRNNFQFNYSLIF